MSKAQKKSTGKKIDIMEEIEKLLSMTSGGSKKSNEEKAVMRAIEKQFGDSFGGSTDYGSTKEGKKKGVQVAMFGIQSPSVQKFKTSVNVNNLNELYPETIKLLTKMIK